MKIKARTAELLEQLLFAEGSQRIILLVEVLSVIGNSKDLITLSSMGFKPGQHGSVNDRMNAVFEYSIRNFKRKIQLDEIAEVANISSHFFCRYFKSRTRKRYSQFLIELRVGHACKLLIKNNGSIKHLCYESGFNNFTCFHKYFKAITGKVRFPIKRNLF